MIKELSTSLWSVKSEQEYMQVCLFFKVAVTFYVKFRLEC